MREQQVARQRVCVCVVAWVGEGGQDQDFFKLRPLYLIFLVLEANRRKVSAAGVTSREKLPGEDD